MAPASVAREVPASEGWTRWMRYLEPRCRPSRLLGKATKVGEQGPGLRSADRSSAERTAARGSPKGAHTPHKWR